MTASITADLAHYVCLGCAANFRGRAADRMACPYCYSREVITRR